MDGVFAFEYGFILQDKKKTAVEYDRFEEADREYCFSICRLLINFLY